jgi:hypothetical protein
MQEQAWWCVYTEQAIERQEVFFAVLMRQMTGNVQKLQRCKVCKVAKSAGGDGREDRDFGAEGKPLASAQGWTLFGVNR